MLWDARVATGRYDGCPAHRQVARVSDAHTFFPPSHRKRRKDSVVMVRSAGSGDACILRVDVALSGVAGSLGALQWQWVCGPSPP